MSTATAAQVWTIDGKPVPHDVYHGSHQIISNTAKEKFRESRKNYADLYVRKCKPFSEPTPALLLGQWAHLAVWEPDEFAALPIPTTAPLKKALADAAALREALLANPCTRQIIEAVGECEHSVRWTDEETGLACKCRRDKVLEHYNGGPTVIVDLKTTNNAHPDDWFRDAATFGYHRNAAWYQAGHHALTGEVPLYAFMVVDKKTHECALYYLEDEDLDIGAQQNAQTLRDMKACFDSGDWRADHETKFTSRPLPEWARKQARQELMQ